MSGSGERSYQAESGWKVESGRLKRAYGGFRTVELKWNYLDFGPEDRAQTGLLISLKQLV